VADKPLDYLASTVQYPLATSSQTQFAEASVDLDGNLRKPTKVDYVPKWEYLVLRRRLLNDVSGRERPRHTGAEKETGAE
jgi:hypothetical protein